MKSPCKSLFPMNHEISVLNFSFIWMEILSKAEQLIKHSLVVKNKIKNTNKLSYLNKNKK